MALVIIRKLSLTALANTLTAQFCTVHSSVAHRARKVSLRTGCISGTLSPHPLGKRCEPASTPGRDPSNPYRHGLGCGRFTYRSWNGDPTNPQRYQRITMRKMIGIALASIGGIGATVGAIYASNEWGKGLIFYVWKLVAGRADGAHRINVSEGSIYYETYGAGSPVLVLHGGLGSLESMSYQIMALSTSHYVVAPDSRGHGRSTDSSTSLSYSVMADDMLKILDRLQMRRVDVVGWSDGGIIGLDLAMRYPDRIRRLVAISANYDVNGLVEIPRSVGEIPRRPLRYALFAADPAQWPTLYRKVVTMWQTQPHYTLNDLMRIKAPTLIMAGERDIVKRQHTDELAKSISDSQEFIIQGGTHAAIYEKPEVANSRILMFLDGGNQ